MTEQFLLRFENWRRWASTRGLYRGHVFSIEGRYASPQHWYPEPPAPAAIDVPDAVLVNRAYTYLAIIAPRQARVIKILTFRAYLRPQWQAQKLGIHYLELEEAHYRAKRALANQLDFVEKQAYKQTVARRLLMAHAISA
jgi:hypothetical protein